MAGKAKAKVAPPNADELLGEIERLGKPNTAKVYARHGVREPSVGLSYGALEALIKRLGIQHGLVAPLWKSGIHDARVLAMRLADPAQVTAKHLDAWLSEASNYIVTGAIAGVASKHPAAEKWALGAIESDHEWRASAGWSVLTDLVLAGRLNSAIAAPLLDRIERTIHRAPNRTRYSMNNTLIAIGSQLEALRDRAFEVADAIGAVEVDHGQTGCKTPAAREYIDKVLNHAAKRGAAKKSTHKKALAKSPAGKTGKKQTTKKSAKKATHKQAPAKTKEARRKA